MGQSYKPQDSWEVLELEQADWCCLQAEPMISICALMEKQNETRTAYPPAGCAAICCVLIWLACCAEIGVRLSHPAGTPCWGTACWYWGGCWDMYSYWTNSCACPRERFKIQYYHFRIRCSCSNASLLQTMFRFQGADKQTLGLWEK